jgi:hypothetical protein
MIPNNPGFDKPFSKLNRFLEIVKKALAPIKHFQLYTDLRQKKWPLFDAFTCIKKFLKARCLQEF